MTNIMRREVKRRLIHEVSHTWKLGVDNNQQSIDFSKAFLTEVLKEPSFSTATTVVEAVLEDTDICTKQNYTADSITVYNPHCRGLKLIAVTGVEAYQYKEKGINHAPAEEKRAQTLCRYLNSGFVNGMFMQKDYTDDKLGVLIKENKPVQTTEHFFDKDESFLLRESSRRYYGEIVKAFTCTKIN